MLFEHIYFDNYDPDTALNCLKFLPSETLALVRHVTIVIPLLPESNHAGVDGEATCAVHEYVWSSVLRCLPSVCFVLFRVASEDGTWLRHLQSLAIRRILSQTCLGAQQIRTDLAFGLLLVDISNAVHIKLNQIDSCKCLSTSSRLRPQKYCCNAST